MAYVSLYRKYRPQTFDDVVGQGHATTTLAHAIEEDRLHHAYLFTGPRGTGKTSTARILAKAINCEQGASPTPCGECEQCVSIADGSAVDVIELDMASHGGVDDARELRDRALFAPARARKKVYILDEVHMASTAAFNALLKLIEEPPGHVMFAMATTDPQKVLPTILSRVQRLDLRRVSARDLVEHVQRVCGQEGYEISPDACEAVVRAGDGSVRDTLSVLEQVLAYAGHQVSVEAVAQVLGHTPADRVFEATEAIASQDLAGALSLVQSLLDDGHDLRRFTLDLVQHLRDLLVLQVAPDRPDLVDATDERRQRLVDQTAALPREALLRGVSVLAETLAEQRQGSPRLPLELALARLVVPAADGDVGALADRIARLEEAGPAPAPEPEPVPGPSAWSEPEPAPEPAASEPAREPSAEPAPADAPEPDPAPAAEAAPSAPDAPAAEADHPRAEPAAAADDAAAPAAEAEPVPVEQPDAPGAGAGAEGHEGPATPEPVPDSASANPGEADPVSGETAEEGERTGEPDLALVERNWAGVLELVKAQSRRCHAVFEPATPVRLSQGILTLRYPQRYASFHAQNAPRGEYADVMIAAVERSCGVRVRLEAIVEGDDDRRRPQPPAVTPDDARTPVLDRDAPEADGGADDATGEAEVREAEERGTGADAGDPEALLADELGAELVDERPPPGA